MTHPAISVFTATLLSSGVAWAEPQQQLGLQTLWLHAATWAILIGLLCSKVSACWLIGVLVTGTLFHVASDNFSKGLGESHGSLYILSTYMSALLPLAGAIAGLCYHHYHQRVAS
ncbi:hypothetical protein [Aliagarivorans marinus]|uniref:hypothetical protein n=1 Tax=Aliagarivorans marinus TaxID=561965 RepID=UPI000411CD3D|nr:hypothetical protein [Aliagarivorans marinus]